MVSFGGFSRCRSSQTGLFVIIWCHFVSCRSIFRWLSKTIMYLSFFLSFFLSFLLSFCLSAVLLFFPSLSFFHFLMFLDSDTCMSFSPSLLHLPTLVAPLSFAFSRCIFTSHLRFSSFLLLSFLPDCHQIHAFLSLSEFLAVCFSLSISSNFASVPSFLFSVYLSLCQSLSLRLPSSLIHFLFLSGSLSFYVSLSLSCSVPGGTS